MPFNFHYRRKNVLWLQKEAGKFNLQFILKYQICNYFVIQHILELNSPSLSSLFLPHLFQIIEITRLHPILPHVNPLSPTWLLIYGRPSPSDINESFLLTGNHVVGFMANWPASLNTTLWSINTHHVDSSPSKQMSPTLTIYTSKYLLWVPPIRNDG